MKKREVDHVLRAAGTITGEKQFIIIGSQSTGIIPIFPIAWSNHSRSIQWPPRMPIEQSG